MAKQKYPIKVSPAGTLKYPRLFKPDTKFKAEGEYSTKLLVPEEEAKPFIEELMAIHKEEYAKACAANKKKALKQAPLPWKPEVNDDGEETGNIEFKTSLKAKVTPKKGDPFEQRPQVIDAKKHKVPASTRVGGGTKAKIAMEVYPWFTAALGFGITLRLKAVQILELSEYEAGGAASMFSEEDGFESEPSGDEGDTTGEEFDGKVAGEKTGADF